MNNALNIKNWKDGGNNYVLKGNPKNKWVGFQESVLLHLQKKFGDQFNIVIWTNQDNDLDYYCIPYSNVKHLFIDTHKATGKYTKRWTAVILDHEFRMHSNSEFSINILPYYGTNLFLKPLIEVDEDFYIENARHEINIRIGQSKFRKGVLRNFNFKCALTEISEVSLLTASHIIPWSHKKEYRGDIANGICLYTEYDALFDKGYISFTNNLEVITTNNTQNISSQLFEKLNLIKGKKLRHPTLTKIGIKYIEYHRAEIFKL